MWTRRQLLTLYDMMERGMSLSQCAQRVGHTAEQCDLAMWAFVCTESVTMALEKINGQGGGGANNPVAVAQ